MCKGINTLNGRLCRWTMNDARELGYHNIQGGQMKSGQIVSWSREGWCSSWPPNRCPCWPGGQCQRCEGASDSMFLTFLEATGALGAQETTCLGSLVSVRAFLSWFTHLRSTPVRSAISLSVKMSPFLVRIMTMAHLLSASVLITSARDPNPVAIVLRQIWRWFSKPALSYCDLKFVLISSDHPVCGVEQKPVGPPYR